MAVEHWANRVLKNGNESFPTFILPMAIVEGLRAQISDVLNERHPVHALMRKYLYGFVLHLNFGIFFPYDFRCDQVFLLI